MKNTQHARFNEGGMFQHSQAAMVKSMYDSDISRIAFWTATRQICTVPHTQCASGFAEHIEGSGGKDLNVEFVIDVPARVNRTF